MARQRLGDADKARLGLIVRDWVNDPDPLVQRAAVAGICEPRLLKDPATAETALDVCQQATDIISALGNDQRSHPNVRTLRQALGYCWSVAVAGNPERGLAKFRQLTESEDTDVEWIVRENLKKRRLSTLVQE